MPISRLRPPLRYAHAETTVSRDSLCQARHQLPLSRRERDGVRGALASDRSRTNAISRLSSPVIPTLSAAKGRDPFLRGGANLRMMRRLKRSLVATLLGMTEKKRAPPSPCTLSPRAAGGEGIDQTP